MSMWRVHLRVHPGVHPSGLRAAGASLDAQMDAPLSPMVNRWVVCIVVFAFNFGQWFLTIENVIMPLQNVSVRKFCVCVISFKMKK